MRLFKWLFGGPAKHATVPATTDEIVSQFLDIVERRQGKARTVIKGTMSIPVILGRESNLPASKDQVRQAIRLSAAKDPRFRANAGLLETLLDTFVPDDQYKSINSFDADVRTEMAAYVLQREVRGLPRIAWHNSLFQ